MKLLKITIKSVTKSQLKKIYHWFNDLETNKYLRSRHKTIKRIIEIISDSKFHNFIINENSIDIGYIFIINKSDHAYLVIIIDKKYWGKGYGRQAMILIEDEVKKMKINKIALGVYKTNNRAYNLYKNLNYQFVKREKNPLILVMEKNF